MAKTWHWYCVNGTGSINADGTQNGSDANHYAWWFDDDGAGNRSANHTSNAGGVLPGAGDAIVGDGGTISLAGNTTWTGMTFAGVLSVTGAGGIGLTLTISCVMNAGASIVNADKAINLDSRAMWLGDANVTGFNIAALTSGWLVNGGNAGGNVSVTGSALAIYLYATGASQVNTFHNMTLTMAAGGYTVDVHQMPAFQLTGQFTHSGESLWVPPVNAVSLTVNGAGYEVVKARASSGGMVTV
jgi:hypothetical protein